MEGLKKGREGGKVESGEGEPKGLKQRPQYEAGGLKTDDMTALRTELPEGVVRENKKRKKKGGRGGRDRSMAHRERRGVAAEPLRNKQEGMWNFRLEEKGMGEGIHCRPEWGARNGGVPLGEVWR